MFSIRHIEQNGAESIRQATWVSYNPETMKFTAGNATFHKCPGQNDGHDTFGNGTIYVMNDSGKTVATYHLKDPAAGRR